jgi:ABC-type multidrug transport system fused ATPase/permease subunit
MTNLPYMLISLRYIDISFAVKFLFAFINNMSMGMGVLLIGVFESTGTGLSFSNISDGINITDHFSMAHILFIMFLNNFLHIFLLYYFDNVLPGDHGIAKPWNFIFKNLYGNKRNNESTINIGNNIEMETKALIENESIYSSKKIGIKIMNLFKVFKQLGQKKRAVDNLSLNIYEGQITVLLGHNGAGKRYINIYISISIILIK